MKYLPILLSLLCFLEVITLRVFLIGGGANENSTLVFERLANIVAGRPPQPKRCNQDWDSTTCPRIAVVTSAAENEAAGNDAYSNDSSSMSYQTMFRNYGMAPKHVTIHVDNYLKDADLLTLRGKANLDMISTADVVYFNGGDQSRHVRSWLRDDATPNILLSTLLSRAKNNDVILAGTSAGSMVWTAQTFGGGSSFGLLYFKNSVGLAPKRVVDGGVNGTGLLDDRNGTRSLQY
jgi:cyanophycinase-like exopeptidase